MQQYIRGRQWPRAPLGLFFAAVGQDGHQGDKVIERLMSSSDGDSYWELAPWPKPARRQLASQIFDRYDQTYGLDVSLDPTWFDDTERECRGDEQNIRAFIKRFVARLDEEFGPPVW